MYFNCSSLIIPISYTFPHPAWHVYYYSLYCPILIAGPTRGTSHACSQGKKEVEEWLSTEEKRRKNVRIFRHEKRGFSAPFRTGYFLSASIAAIAVMRLSTFLFNASISAVLLRLDVDFFTTSPLVFKLVNTIEDPLP